MLKKLLEVQGKTAQQFHKICPQSWEWARSIEGVGIDALDLGGVYESINDSRDS